MKFAATTRDVQGTGASRRLRRAGRVPAIVYGGNAEPTVISLEHNQIFHDLRKEAFHASILNMDLDGKTESVLLRAVQWHPYKPLVLHVDFQRVVASQAITTRVPLHFINGDASPAVKLHSQVVSHVLTELEITCLPADLPVNIQVDLGELDANANLYLDAITLPEGVQYAGNDENPLLAAALPVGGSAGSDSAEEDSGDSEESAE